MKNEFIIESNLHTLKFDQKYNVVQNKEILLTNGWYAQEKWGGVWSRGTASRVVFKIDKTKIKNDIIMTLKTKIFGTRDKTKILINGRLVGLYQLGGIKKIKIQKKLLDSDLIMLEFHHTNVKSPKELGVSSDRRKIKLGLESIKFIVKRELSEK